MAEIYRARLASQEGAGRLLVIKRIQAGYGENAEFLSMFKSEIKVTMGFNHPNIVQLYDFGDEGGQPYIAMEYVDGKNLRQFMSRFLELKQRFPIDIAVHIIEQAASGLHYAHAFRDKISGESLNIVHRDISPQNLLLSYEGSVKVIDFGIAKAATNSEATRAGVIKGKPSYLSPEQINGDTLDGRSDLFSLAAVLWELLAGKKLFAGDNDLAILKLIESCQTYVKPPSTLNPEVPPELDYIVLKALAKHRDKRYQSAEEFQRALHKFLYSFAPDFNPSDLNYHAKDMFKNEIVEDRKRIQKANDEVERLILSPVPLAPPPPSAAEKYEESAPIPPLPEEKAADATSVAVTPKVVIPFEVFAKNAAASETHVVLQNQIHADQSQGENPSEASPTALLRNAKPLGSNLPLSNTSKVSGTGPGMLGVGPRPNTRSNAASDFASPIAKQNGNTFTPLAGSVAREYPRSDGEGSSWLGKLVIVAVAAGLAVVFLGKGLGVHIPGLSSQSGSEGERRVANVPKKIDDNPPLVPTVAANVGDVPNIAPAGANTIQLRLNVSPGGGAVTLKVGSPTIQANGKLISLDNPVLTVPLDQTIEVEAERSGYKHFHTEFYVDSHEVGSLKEWSKDVPMEPNQFGYLSVHTTPNSDAIIAMDAGKPWVIKTPFENEKVPVGTYQVRFVNELLGMEKKVTIKVEDNKILNIDERLEIKD